MASRLRRMLLINTRTSGKFSSNAINEVDPRDGAAVTGDNVIGKTTTLELIPLFFGSLPSQIAESGSGREPMLRFVLPTAQSAIVFEYQRGQSEDDVRFVVIRRQEGSDAPEYRFFRGSFRDDVFIMVDAAGQRLLMDDASSIDAARRLGLEFERKMNSSDYRSVILGHKATNKSEVNLRQIGNQYSYAAKSLPNLDRLVAAVVKEKIDFRDFINVVVTIVQDTIGGPTKVGTERNGKFSLGQSRDQINRWLADREACERAFKLDPQVDLMRNALSGHSHQKRVLGDMLGDVCALKLARTNEKTRLTGALALANDTRKQAEPQEKALSDTLAGVTQTAHASLKMANSLYETEQGRHHFFIQEDVSAWETSVNSIPGLQIQKQQLEKQIEIATGQSGEIASKYLVQIGQVSQDESAENLRLEKSKAVPTTRHTDEINELNRDEKAQIDQNELTSNAALAELSDKRTLLEGELGGAREQATNPSASAEAIEAAESAGKRVSDHQSAMQSAGELVLAAQKAAFAAATIFRETETKHGNCQAALDKAKAALHTARLTLSPDSGSLLAALRAAPDVEWKRTLARVIDPALLLREDLNPHQLHGEGPDASIFGWTLDTQQITAPIWTNDDELRREVSVCDDRLKLCEQNLIAAASEMSIASGHLKTCNEQSTLETSKTTILDAKLKPLQESRQICSDRRDRQKKQAEELAKQRMVSIQKDIDANKTQEVALKGAAIQLRDEIRAAVKGKVAEATARLAATIKQIDAQISACEQQAKSMIASLEEQRDKQLQDAGVDVSALNALTEEAVALDDKIRMLNEKKPVVEQWKAWLVAVGPRGLEALERAASTAKHDHGVAETAQSDHAAAIRAVIDRFDSETTAYSKRLGVIEGDLTELQVLEESLSGYQSQALSAIDPEMTAAELRSRIQAQRRKLENLEDDITHAFKKLRDELTGTPSTVRDFVEMQLAEVKGKDVLRQADELSLVHRRLGREIVPNINNGVTSILDNVRQFRKRITDFESAVKTFNNNLGEGLSASTKFDRLQDLVINVVTDFSALGFMKKLDALNGVIRDHQIRVIGDTTRDLPPESTARALRDLMSVIGQDGGPEVDLSKHITLSGSVTVSGVAKQFKRESDLEHISSTGQNAIILITLLSGMLNMIRGKEPIYIPWVTDEVGKFDSKNFHTLMQMLRNNHIDVVTASPKLTIAELRHFSRCYRFGERGSIARYILPGKRRELGATSTVVEY